MWVSLITVVGASVSAFLAVRTRRLLVAALWLACTSALLSVLFYNLGAHEVAVIELSVGAGLVTILFVFGISIAGEESMDASPLVHWSVAGALVIIAMGLLGWLVLPAGEAASAVVEPSFSAMLWQERGLDVMVQIGLIFAGVLGILGILSEVETVRVRRPLPESGESEAPGIAGGDVAVAVVKES